MPDEVNKEFKTYRDLFETDAEKQAFDKPRHRPSRKARRGLRAGIRGRLERHPEADVTLMFRTQGEGLRW
jgi:hypothetical protein